MLKVHWAILSLGLTVVQVFSPAICAGENPPMATPKIVAEVRQRVETDRLEVRVYQGKRLVQLAGYMELLVVTPLPGPPSTMENLARKSVAIIRSEKQRDRWEVYQDVWASTGGTGDGRYLTLADNVFKVKQVFVSSRRKPLELRLDGQILRLKPGDALLVL